MTWQVFFSTKALRFDFVTRLLGEHSAALSSATSLSSSRMLLLYHVLSLLSSPASMVNLLPGPADGVLPSPSCLRAPSLTPILPHLLAMVECEPVRYVESIMASLEAGSADVVAPVPAVADARSASVAACAVLSAYIQLLLSEPDTTVEGVCGLVLDLIASGRTVLELTMKLLAKG